MYETYSDNKIVVTAAFRYNQGASGGPGGCNALLEIHNKKFNVIPSLRVEYRKRCIRSEKLHRLIRNLLKKMGRGYILDNIEFKDFLKRVLKNKEDCHYIIHEPKTSAELAKLHIPFITVYHQQGSTAAERRSFGHEVSSTKEERLTEIERLAFMNSNKIVFPSLGARDAYFSTCMLNDNEKEVIMSKSLIINNTSALPDLVQDTSDKYKLPDDVISLESFVASDKLKGQKLIILTVSSLTELKGVSDIPDFLNTIPHFRDNFIWVLVGRGHLEEEIIDRIEKNDLKDNFLFINKKLNQSELRYLYRISCYYLMLHRISIFDMATLEAMSEGCIPVLSKVGGNIEMNKESNVLWTNPGMSLSIESREIERLSILNRNVYTNSFGPEAFLRSYLNLF